MSIARVALPVAVDSSFDYWVPAGLNVEPGALVRVRLGQRALVGVVVDMVDATAVADGKLQPIVEVLRDLRALSSDLLDLARFVSAYYQEPLGLVLGQMLPPLSGGGRAGARPPTVSLALRLTAEGRLALGRELVRAPRARALYEAWMAAPDATLAPPTIASLGNHLKRTLNRWRDAGWAEEVPDARTPVAPAGGIVDGMTLNPDQLSAVAAINRHGGGYASFLLQGVTGSGKTEVYLAAAAACLAAGRQALLLVPEINLTPQFAERIAGALPGHRTVTLHSRLAPAARRRHWQAAADGEVDVVLGTRLAVFAPMPRLGLIIVDEEHDPSFKQQDGVRYHGRDVAVWRARQRGVPVVLGSATPSLESLLHARSRRYFELPLPRRAVRGGPPTDARLRSRSRLRGDRRHQHAVAVDGDRGKARARASSRWSSSIAAASRPRCSARPAAGRPDARRCSARLVVHREAGELRCHHCGHARATAARVPRMRQRRSSAAGARHAASRASARAAIPGGAHRADRPRQHAGEGRVRGDARTHPRRASVDILVGTQMLAKGHDFPG